MSRPPCDHHNVTSQLRTQVQTWRKNYHEAHRAGDFPGTVLASRAVDLNEKRLMRLVDPPLAQYFYGSKP